MSVIFPHSPPETVWLIGTVECPTATDRPPSARRAYVGCFRRIETVLDRALIAMLILALGAGAAIAAAPTERDDATRFDQIEISPLT